MKEQEKSPGKTLRKQKYKEFKEIVIRILTKLESGTETLRDNFNS